MGNKSPEESVHEENGATYKSTDKSSVDSAKSSVDSEKTMIVLLAQMSR